jgi:hypothetical protein
VIRKRELMSTRANATLAKAEQVFICKIAP